MDFISLFPLIWPPSSVVNFHTDDGLWDNAGRVSIHWPHFQKAFGAAKHVRNSFYISYDDTDIVERMTFSYSALNDIVFSNAVHRGCKKARIFTSLVPNNEV